MRIKQLERELERAGHARQVAHDKEVGKAKADLQRERLYVKQLKAELAEHNTEVAARNTESLKQLQDAGGGPAGVPERRQQAPGARGRAERDPRQLQGGDGNAPD